MFDYNSINEILKNEVTKKYEKYEKSEKSDQDKFYNGKKILYISYVCLETYPCRHETLVENEDGLREIIYTDIHNPGYVCYDFKKYLMSTYDKKPEFWKIMFDN